MIPSYKYCYKESISCITPSLRGDLVFTVGNSDKWVELGGWDAIYQRSTSQTIRIERVSIHCPIEIFNLPNNKDLSI